MRPQILDNKKTLFAVKHDDGHMVDPVPVGDKLFCLCLLCPNLDSYTNPEQVTISTSGLRSFFRNTIQSHRILALMLSIFLGIF